MSTHISESAKQATFLIVAEFPVTKQIRYREYAPIIQRAIDAATAKADTETKKWRECAEKLARGASDAREIFETLNRTNP